MSHAAKLNISFTLDAFKQIHDNKNAFIVVLSLLFSVIIITNGLIISTILFERKLHKPMYLFICNMCFINVYGGSAVAPFIIDRLFTENYEITWLSCLMHVFFIHTYAYVDITNLTVMAYDRYISICYPLNYEKIVTPTKVIIAVVFTWLLPFVRFSITIFLTARLEICGRIIEKIYCDNYSVVKLACSDISVSNIYGLVMTSVFFVLPFLVIIYSYLRIILICLDLSKSGRSKLFSTCVPHLVALLSFIIGSCFEIFQSRFNMKAVPYMLRVMLSLYFLILSPIINALLYGAKTQAIKEVVIRKLNCKLYQRQAVVNFKH